MSLQTYCLPSFPVSQLAWRQAGSDVQADIRTQTLGSRCSASWGVFLHLSCGSRKELEGIKTLALMGPAGSHSMFAFWPLFSAVSNLAKQAGASNAEPLSQERSFGVAFPKVVYK